MTNPPEGESDNLEEHKLIPEEEKIPCLSVFAGRLLNLVGSFGITLINYFFYRNVNINVLCISKAIIILDLSTEKRFKRYIIYGIH